MPASTRPGWERQQTRFYVIAGLAALALRLLWVFFFPGIVDDSRLYANIADNWLQHGVYGITNSGVIMPTLSRLPGYPAFLAAIFTLFGRDNFRAVLLVQVFIDLGSCFLIAHLAWRIFSPRAAKAAFLMAGLCPFLANYAASALTETLEIFFTVLALDLAVQAFDTNKDHRRESSSLRLWLLCGLAIAGAILLRPDGGILLIAIGGYLFWLFVRALWPRRNAEQMTQPARIILLSGALLAIGAVAPLIPWTLRNLHTLHRFQPLAPRYANDSDEPLMPGFNRWVKTWMAEYVSVEEIYWKVPGDTLDLTLLPNRACDSVSEREQTAALFDLYNRDHDMTRELDDGFASIAADRIRTHPLRYYIWLPSLRIADMWLRPRTELLPSDPRWWEFNDDHRWLAVSLVFGAMNLLYVAAAAAGWVRSYKFFAIDLFVFFLLLRSAFLGTLENPEPRYTLECYPVIIILGAAIFHSRP